MQGQIQQSNILMQS